METVLQKDAILVNGLEFIKCFSGLVTTQIPFTYTVKTKLESQQTPNHDGPEMF